jgi:protoporphyrinogen/coproporphyrinogen III oxidase
MAKIMDIDVAIVGAGVGGLSLAYALQEQGVKVVILEASDQVGGLIKTSRKDGFLIEKGPNSIIEKPALMELIFKLGLDRQVLYPKDISTNRYIAMQKNKRLASQLIEAPKKPTQAIFTPLLAWHEKLRILREPFITKRESEDESIASFVSRRFGKAVANNIVSALISGIWAADISKLSCRSAMPQLWAMEKTHGSVLISSIKAHKQKTNSRLRMLTFKSGLETLPIKLSEKLEKGSIRFNVNVSKIEVKDNKVCIFVEHALSNQKEILRANKIVLATSSDVTSTLLSNIHPNLALSIASIPHAPLGVLQVAFKKSDVSHPLNAFGFLVPPKTNRALLGAIFSSSVFPNRAPSEKHLITCFSGGATNPEFAKITKNHSIKSNR